MKKILKSVMAAALALIILISFFACGEEDTTVRKGKAYGMVYNSSSLCKVEMTTTGSKIDSVSFDELALINDWSDKSVISGETENADWQEVTVNSAVSYYAKKVQFGDRIFYSDNAGVYTLDDGTQFADWIKNGDNAEYYWNCMQQGNYYILKENGDKYDVTYLPLSEGQTTDKSKRFFKTQNGYWQAGGYGKGYIANMEAISAFVKSKGVGYKADDAAKNDQGNFVLGGVDTGASVASFKDYYKLAQKAYENRSEIQG